MFSRDSEQRRKKRWIIAGAVCVLAIGSMFAMTACTGTPSQGAAETAEQPAEAAAPAVPEDTWKKAYREILSENESEIWNYEVGEYGSGVGCASALCDLNHDAVPELLFFSIPQEQYSAELQIYTCRQSGAEKIDYTCTWAIPYPGEGDDRDRPYCDAMAAGGTKYIIYTESKSNRFAIYSTVTDENIVVQMNRFEADEECNITEIENLGFNFDFVKYDGETYVGSSDTVDLDEAEIYVNRDEASKKAFLKSYTPSVNAMDQVIFCSEDGARGDDEVIWDKAEGIGALALSYDEMMSELKTRSGEDAKAGRTDQKNVKYGEIMEKILDAYAKGDIRTASDYNRRLPELADQDLIPSDAQEAFDEVYDQLDSEGQLSEYGAVCYYCDVDNDGKAEYLIQTGDCEADYMLQCYKYRAGEAVWIGETGSGHSSFHQYPNHNGIIQKYGHMGYEGINVITFDDGEVGCVEIGTRGELDESDQYLQLGCLLQD